MRKNISTNTPSEKRVGYSRAVRIGDRIYFSGTTSVNEKGQVVGQTLYEQTKFIIEKVKKVLDNEGFSLADAIVVKAYVVDMDELSEFDKAFSEYFGKIKPACTLVGINELVSDELLIEMEFIAEKS